MANLDSASKRASSVQTAGLFALAPPIPDGTLDQGDRQHITSTYSGVLAQTPPPPPPASSGQLYGKRRHGHRGLNVSS